MKKIKTSELTDAALDWAVELAKGTHWSSNGYFCFDNPKRYDPCPEWRYSTEWCKGGPIIELEGIGIMPPISADPGCDDWLASNLGIDVHGPTPLIAAMRCFVTSKLGDEVDVPEELL